MNAPAHPHPVRRARRAGGFTMIEVCCSIGVLVIGLLGTVSTFSRCRDLERATLREERLRFAADAAVEEWRSADLDTAVADAATGAKRGDPNDEVLTTPAFPEELLSEVLDPKSLDTLRYRDLDGDGDVELDGASTASFSLLPLRIRCEYETGEFVLPTLVTR